MFKTESYATTLSIHRWLPLMPGRDRGTENEAKGIVCSQLGFEPKSGRSDDWNLKDSLSIPNGFILKFLFENSLRYNSYNLELTILK